jgi:hypothetical protein
MANNRCFDSFNTTNLSARERSSEKRNTTIYNEIRENIIQLNSGNPVKRNGFKYNRNSIINTTCDISSGFVNVASSYELRNNIKQGAEQVYPVQVSTPKYQSWCGNLYSIDYLKHGVKTVVQADASFNNIVVDPSYILFYNNCDIDYENINRPEQWTIVVDLSFQSTFYARQANNSINPCST